MCEGCGDEPLNGAEVEDSGTFQVRVVADELNDVFDEGLGVGAGDEDVSVTSNSRLKKWSRPVR